MARGKAKEGVNGNTGTMPVFVDIKLTPEQRQAFSSWFKLGGNRTIELQKFADTGYRVGVSWSGEHQSYTVSVTCRDDESPNNGLCMTSFARDLCQAIALAWWKHEVAAKFDWSSHKPLPSEEFG